MKKNEAVNQMIFSQLLAEVDATQKKKGNEIIPLKSEVFSQKEEEHQQAQIKALRKQLVKERYTKYCIEWILGQHIKARLTSNFVPHIDKILPLYRTKVDGKEHNFLSALVGFKDFQGADLFLHHPDIQKILFSNKGAKLVNLECVKSDLKKEILTGEGFKNAEFSALWQTLKSIYGSPKLTQMVLFDTQENDPLSLQKKSVFNKKRGVFQTGLSLLITQGAFLEALDYMRSLPKETTLGDVCSLVDDPLASAELKRLASKKNFKSKEEVVFISTLEKNLPTSSFLKLTQNYNGVATYKEEDLISTVAINKPFPFLKKKINSNEQG